MNSAINVKKKPSPNILQDFPLKIIMVNIEEN